MNIKKNKYLGIWFFGISGSGKSFASRYLSKKLKKSILIDGDFVRANISTDLGYSVKDRIIQLKRCLGIAKLCIQSGAFPILSSVYIPKKFSQTLKKEKILLVKIERDFNQIKKYKIYRLRKNVVGKDIKYQKFRHETLENSGDKKFLKYIDSYFKLK